MTEVDKKNSEIILDALSKYSLSDESFSHIKSIFSSPDIDPIYAKVLGPDLRARWNLDYKFLMDKGLISNEGYGIFNDIFVYYQIKGTELGFPKIDVTSFSENKILWKKNIVKLKKILVEFYNSRRDYLYEQWKRNRSALELPTKSKQDFNDDASLAEQYVLKGNEYVGRFKIPEEKNVYELVMSNNLADWFMCSTGERWSSCLSLTSQHGYWTGLPFIFDDKNRTMFYITSQKRRKNFMGIEVDGFNNRSWGLLDNKDNIRTIRWFPDSFLNLESMWEVTGLPLKDTNNYDGSKYTILSKIHFSDGNAHTPYLDFIGVEKNIDGEVVYCKGGRTGVTSINVKGEKVSIHLTNQGFESFIKSGRPFFKFLYTKICSHCNNDIVQRDPFHYNGKFYCETCRTEQFYACSSCSNEHLKEGQTAAKIYESKKYCPRCFESYFAECKCCKEIHKKNLMKDCFCKKCISDTSKVAQCKNDGCTTHVLLEKGIHFHSKEFGDIVTCSSDCATNFRETMKKENKISHFTCPHCNHNHDERDGIFQFDGTLWCVKCTWKIADKKQMKFVFKATA